MASDSGFSKAKWLLQQNFGNEHKIATAYMERALSWPLIRAEDTRALQAYTVYLRGCCNAMEDVNYMFELNIPANMLAILKKLPYRLRDLWRTVACDIQEKHHQRAAFKDIVEFLERQVKIATDPIFGDIKDPPPVSKGIRRPHPSGNIFAINVKVT